MAKLWEKGYTLDAVIERFTVGNDFMLDTELIYYDCIGSIAHAYMLMHIGILTKNEFIQLKKELTSIIQLAAHNAFVIKTEDEDVHTAIENTLIYALADLGKKIHTARSRNDQILLDLRLYMRDQLFDVVNATLTLCTTLSTTAYKYKDIPIPGRTHFQRAMPSSIGLLFSAYAESLLDTLILLKSTYEIINQNPLGSAASYGVAIPIDRQLVAELLGFDKVQNNVLYANNSRGKIESIVLSALTQIMVDLSKLATDLIIFSAPEFGYFEIPQELCSGSSLMPQKRNPCGLELVRAKSATVISLLMQTLTTIRGLPSGYNRDFQETKEPLMQGLTITRDSLAVCTHTIEHIKVNVEACINSFSPELFATDYALRLVQEGHPFRDAYKKVAQNPYETAEEDPQENIRSKVHKGAPGNLGIELIQQRCQEYTLWAQETQTIYKRAINKLIEEIYD